MAKPPDKNKSIASKSAISADDAALFTSAMRDVKKLSGKTKKAVAPDQAFSRDRQSPRHTKRRSSAPVQSPSALPALASGESADVDARTMDRLRRGRLRPEARLDLHGLTQEKAHRSLNRFIDQAQASGARSLIIITGKGRVSEGGGVLRNQVPKWLNAPDLRPRILAFTPAQPRDGGAGALYVLLRRQR